MMNYDFPKKLDFCESSIVANRTFGCILNCFQDTSENWHWLISYQYIITFVREYFLPKPPHAFFTRDKIHIFETLIIFKFLDTKCKIFYLRGVNAAIF